jgi:voltage-gated potassium channel
VVTIATLGYGDLVPKTAAGKILAIAYVIRGISVFVAAVAGLGEHIARKGHRE